MTVLPAATRPPSLWVTRPAEDAADVADALLSRGYRVVVEPLLVIKRHSGPPLDLAGVQALLATSANGVRALAARSGERHLPLLSVGDATARAARAAGFTEVASASGDVADLAELVKTRLNPRDGALLHVASSAVAGDLAGALGACGFDCRRVVLYDARGAQTLSQGLVARIRAREVDGVVLFSPRTAKTLVRLLAAEDLSHTAAGMSAHCLSRNVADAVSALPWRRIVTAPEPTQAGLLDAIDLDLGGTADALKSFENGAAADSLSSSGAFVGTLSFNSQNSDVGTGGMISDEKNDPRPEDGGPTAPVPGAASSAAERPSSRSGEPWGSSGGASPVDASPADPAPSGAPTGRGGGGALAWVLAALVLVAAGAAAAWFFYFEPRQQQAQQAQQAPLVDPQAEIDAALGDLDARETKLRQQLAGMQPRLDALERSVSQLSRSVEDMAGRAGQSDAELVAQLGERISRLESQAANATSLAQQVRSLEVTTAAARDAASKVSTTVLAVGQLVQAAEGGGDFVRQLAAVRAMGGDDPEIAQAAASLENYASSGIPTLATLRASFPETAAAVARAEPVAEGDAWTDKVVNRLTSLVTVRRTGPSAMANEGVDGILARAESAVFGGDLQTAVKALDELQGPPAEAAADWLQLARSRLEAERLLATLQQRALVRLSAAGG